MKCFRCDREVAKTKTLLGLPHCFLCVPIVEMAMREERKE